VKRRSALKGNKAFQEVYQKGKRYQKRGIQIIVLRYGEDTREYPAIKMGISIGKRYGKAYKRNIAKRQIRAIWRENLKNMKSGFSIIVRSGETSNILGYGEKREILLELLRRAGVLTV
jgi:ribonuclease P protein component